MSPEQPLDLVSDLRALGEPLRTEPPPDELMDTVMTRVAESRTPHRPTRPRRLGLWRWTTAIVAGLLAVVLLVPPIRAAVFDWFDFAGVIVRESPGTAPSNAPEPPTPTGDLSLDKAQQLVGFEPAVPRSLGAPDAVDVLHDRRILSMTWRTPVGVVRMDQFNGSLAPMFMKQIYGDATATTVRGETALWFADPHQVVVLDDEGETHDVPPRLAGSTLIWQRTGVTFRLEGDVDLGRALEIARSTRTSK